MSLLFRHVFARHASLPRWAEVIDYTTVITIVLALCVFAFGGFREYIGGVRLSIRSWDRLVVLALLLTTIRHVLAPRPWAGIVLTRGVLRWWRSGVRRAVGPA